MSQPEPNTDGHLTVKAGPPSGGDRYDQWVGRLQRGLAPILGAAIVIQQTFLVDEVQPILLIFAAGALGLPLAIGLDRRLK